MAAALENVRGRSRVLREWAWRVAIGGGAYVAADFGSEALPASAPWVGATFLAALVVVMALAVGLSFVREWRAVAVVVLIAVAGLAMGCWLNGAHRGVFEYVAGAAEPGGAKKN